LGEVRDTTQGQAELLKIVRSLNIDEIAEANVVVYDKLKNCTDEIGALGEMLSASKDYVKSVTKLNDKLDKSDERIKTIEAIGKFFIEERSNFSVVNRYLGQTEEALFESIKIFKENTEKQFSGLVEHTNEQRKRCENVIAEETEALKTRMKELSMITEELKNLSAVKTTMGNLEKATKEQNAKIDALTKSIKELASIKTTGGTSIPFSFWSLLPKWGKIVIFIFLGLIVFTCIAYIVFNILALVLN
jgi:DNA repair exonuclease SbcCD ATPase subunit